MAARFEKVPTPGLTLDGFDANNTFQMVPAGDSRSMGAVTEGESCVLRVAQPATILLTNLRTSVGSPLVKEVPPAGVTLAPRSRVAFSILGLRTGRNEVRLIGPDGRTRAGLTVSVKAAVTRSVSIVMVADRVRTTTRDPADAMRIVSKVDEISGAGQCRISRLQQPAAVDLSGGGPGSEDLPCGEEALRSDRQGRVRPPSGSNQCGHHAVLLLGRRGQERRPGWR